MKKFLIAFVSILALFISSISLSHSANAASARTVSTIAVASLDLKATASADSKHLLL